MGPSVTVTDRQTQTQIILFPRGDFVEKNKDVVQRVLSSIVDEYRHIILDQVSVTSLSLSPHHLIGQKNFDSHSYQLGLIWDAMSERQQTVKLSKEAAEKRGNKLDNDMMKV